MACARRRAVLLLDATVNPLEFEVQSSWQSGPAEVALGSVRTTRAVRSTYFSHRAAKVLYGSGEDSTRWWRNVEPCALGDSTIDCIEVVVPRRLQESGIVVLHMTLADDPLLSISEVVHLDKVDGSSGHSIRTNINRLLNGVAKVDDATRRGFQLSFITFDIMPTEVPSSAGGQGPRQWTTFTKWLWLMASATPFSRFDPDPEGGDYGTPLVLSAQWRGLALRDGIAFIGQVPEPEEFFSFAEIYMRTIYTDAAILARLQRSSLENIANRLADECLSYWRTPELIDLEADFDAFKSVYWWEDLGSHGNANTILHALQDQYRLPELIQRVSSDLRDHSQFVDSMAASRTNSYLGLVAIVGLPTSVILSLVQVFNSTGWVIGILSVAFIGVTAATVLSTRIGRMLLRPIMRSGRIDRG